MCGSDFVHGSGVVDTSELAHLVRNGLITRTIVGGQE